MYNTEVLIALLICCALCIIGIVVFKKACTKYLSAMEADPPNNEIQIFCTASLGTILILAYITCWIGGIATGIGAAIMIAIVA